MVNARIGTVVVVVTVMLVLAGAETEQSQSGGNHYSDFLVHGFFFLLYD